jgi:hypothetical protein
VTFNQSLAGCVAVGTIGSLGFHDTDTALYADFGEPNANSVAVEIWHLAPTRALADNSFHLPPWVSGFCEVRRRGGLAGRFYPGHRVQKRFRTVRRVGGGTRAEAHRAGAGAKSRDESALTP